VNNSDFVESLEAFEDLFCDLLADGYSDVRRANMSTGKSTNISPHQLQNQAKMPSIRSSVFKMVQQFNNVFQMMTILADSL
jgi:hypothetical protein